MNTVIVNVKLLPVVTPKKTPSDEILTAQTMTCIHPKCPQVTSLIATYDNSRHKRTGKMPLKGLVNKIEKLYLACLESLNRMTAGASVLLSTRILWG